MIYIVSFVGSDYEALELTVKIEQAKSAMEMATGVEDHQRERE